MVAPNRLRRNFNSLKKLKNAKRAQRRTLLEAASKDLIVCVCDCARNIINGNIGLKPKDKKKLARHKHTLRKLASGGTKGVNKKRRLLVQKGGFLPLLLGPILGLAGGLLRNAFGDS